MNGTTENEDGKIAFSVDGLYPDYMGVPQNGVDYLRRVRWETLQQKSFVAVADKGIIPESSEIIDGTAFNEWDEEMQMRKRYSGFIEWFQSKRNKIHQKKKGKKEVVRNIEDVCPICQNNIELCKRIELLTVVSLGSFIRHLADDHCDLEGEEQETTDPHTVVYAAFTVFCHIESPLIPDDAANCRVVGKWCMEKWKERLESKQQPDNELLMIKVLSLIF